MISVVTQGLYLYRYDLQQPMQDWCRDAINPEYDTSIGPKNKAGLFFFTTSIEVAKGCGLDASFRRGSKDKIYLTSCHTVRELKIIDFIGCVSIYDMLRTLSDINLNVMTDDFKTYEDINDILRHSFSLFKPIYDKIEEDVNDSEQLKEKLFIRPDKNYKNTSAFGQRLTDFENGPLFVSLVKITCPDVEGYRWYEGGVVGEYTYCFFNHSMLSAPKVTKTINRTEQRDIFYPNG